VAKLFEQDGRILDKERAKARAKPFLWWDDPALADLNLPPGGEVWHYNPISVLIALAGLETADALQFSQQFEMTDPNGRAIAGLPYQIREASTDRIVVAGLTGQDGLTERVYSDKPDTYVIERAG